MKHKTVFFKSRIYTLTYVVKQTSASEEITIYEKYENFLNNFNGEPHEFGNYYIALGKQTEDFVEIRQLLSSNKLRVSAYSYCLTDTGINTIFGGIESLLNEIANRKELANVFIEEFKEFIKGKDVITFDFHRNYIELFNRILKPIFTNIYVDTDFTSSNGSNRHLFTGKVV